MTKPSHAGLKACATYCFAAFAVAALTATLRAQVTPERLANAAREPQQWLTYSGQYNGSRYSPLDQVNKTNVNRLNLQWVFQTGVSGWHETTPLVVDGMMYITAPQNHAFAVDVRTGRPLWHYERALPKTMSLCCGPQNRGMAALGDKVFMGTLDAHVVALDAKTGRVRWDVAAAEADKGYSFTGAPLAVKDKVIIGVAGGEYGIRGFIDAYDAETGKRAWRFYTIPGEGEKGNDSWAGDSWKRGGAPTWVTGSYDPELNLVYWGTGNPGPQMYGANRAGDNLYSDSLLALDPDTGTLKWHFQFTPHDVHDWDSTQVPVLADLTINGTPRKTMLFANRNGFFYVLDRTNGKMILAKPFVEQNWAKEISPEGRPILVPGTNPSEEGSIKTCPDLGGGTNFFSPSYDPSNRLFFVNSRETCAIYYSWNEPFRQGEQYESGGTTRPRDQKNYGALRAIDPITGDRKWEFRYPTTSSSGVLSTASGIVFTGDGDGNVIALDSKTGKYLWHYQLGNGLRSTGGTTYMVDGKQYLLLPSGSALTAFALP